MLNVPNALAAGFTNWGQQAGQNIAQGMQLRREQQKQNALGALLPQALAGDKNALAQAYQIDPGVGFKVQQYVGEQAATKSKLSQELFDKAASEADLALANSQNPAADLPTIRQAFLGKFSDHPDIQAKIAQHIPEQWDESMRPLIMAGAGIKPAAPAGPTDLMRNLADPTAAAFLREQEANKLRMREMGLSGDAYHPLAMTSAGALQFVNGQWQPVQIGGATALPVSADVGLAGQKASAVAQGKEQGAAVANLQATLDSADQAVQAIDGVLNAPGRATMTGLSGSLDPRNYVAGTDAADARVKLDQIKGQTFLQAYNSLRGGGQITEAEGAKAEAALARLNTKQSDAEFVKSLRDLRSVIENGRRRAVMKAQGAPASAGAPASSLPGGWTVQEH